MTTKASRNSMKPSTRTAFSACHSFFAGNTTATNRLSDTALAVSFFVVSGSVAILLRSVLVLPILLFLLAFPKIHRKVKQSD